MFQDNVRSIIAGTIHDQDLSGHAGAAQAFLTPVHELTDGNLFIQSWASRYPVLLLIRLPCRSGRAESVSCALVAQTPRRLDRVVDTPESTTRPAGSPPPAASHSEMVKCLGQ